MIRKIIPTIPLFLILPLFAVFNFELEPPSKDSVNKNQKVIKVDSDGKVEIGRLDEATNGKIIFITEIEDITLFPTKDIFDKEIDFLDKQIELIKMQDPAATITVLSDRETNIGIIDWIHSLLIQNNALNLRYCYLLDDMSIDCTINFLLAGQGGDWIVNDDDLSYLLVSADNNIVFEERVVEWSNLRLQIEKSLRKNPRAIFLFTYVADSLKFGEYLDIHLMLKESGAKRIYIDPYGYSKLTLPDPPARPSIPIASDEDFDDEDYDIFETDFDEWEDWDAPPPDEEGDSEFVAYDKAPVPVTPISPVYPEIAKSMGTEGKVFVKFFVDKKGKVDPNKITIVKGIVGLNEAAIEAVKRSKWKPAMQRDRKVGIYMTVPVNFVLTQSN